MDELIKKYICKCGKEYTNSQAFNGHKSSCKVHLTALGKSITNSNLYNPEIQAKAHATLAKNNAVRRQKQLEQWIAEQHTCERCGKVMTEKFASGRFCSKTCANTREYSQETRDKLSKAATAQAAKRSKTTNTIRIAKVDRIPTSILELSKRTVSKLMIRMQLPCSCCGAYVPGVVWDVHHIKPRHLGGSDLADNLTYICPNCHRICHTNTALLTKPLVSLEDYLKLKNINWQEYYFAKVK